MLSAVGLGAVSVTYLSEESLESNRAIAWRGGFCCWMKRRCELAHPLGGSFVTEGSREHLMSLFNLCPEGKYISQEPT